MLRRCAAKPIIKGRTNSCVPLKPNCSALLWLFPWCWRWLAVPCPRPSTVGSIGGVEIPAGIYLLAQYNSYNTASGVAELATGETASDVKAVLKATCTGTINGEDVTACRQ